MTETTHQDGPTPGPEPRCPECDALRPPAVTWCTQCYARFDVPQAAVPHALPPQAAVPEQPSRGSTTGEPDLGPSAPPRAAASVAPVAPEEVEARAQELLARLAGEGGAGDERVRSWSGLVQGTGPKAVAMVVGTLVLTGLLFAAMAVLGSLL